MRAVILAAAAVVLVGGCGQDVPRGRLHGTVKYQGKPFPGTVIFLAKDNQTHTAELKADGSYDVSGVALGPVKVSIQQPVARSAVKGEFALPSSQAKGVMDEKAGKSPTPLEEAPKAAGPRIPTLYADANKSGLDFELKTADQEWSRDLK
jgi:hypothetical protein